MRLFKIMLLLCTAVLYTQLAQAEVYKWKDKQGNWQYSDIKPIDVEAPETVATTKHSQAKQPKLQSMQADAPESSVLSVEVEDPVAKQKSCDAAKANMMAYSIGGRVRRTDKHGKISYLNEQEITAAKKEAQSQVKQYCS